MENSKTILVTGGAGFIGHHLIEGVLKNTDWRIVNLDGLNYAADLNRLTDVEIWEKEKHRVKFVWHDLRSPISELKHIQIGKVDYIWHLAAETHVDRSLENSIPFVQANVEGTANLLEYVKHFQPNLIKFNYFSTDEVFGPAPLGVYYKEYETLNPSNPYAATKEGAEALVKAFAFCFKIPVVITRTMNVLGERQHPEKFVPKTIKAILNGEKVKIHGTPEVGFSSRCWIHAREACNALLFLMENSELIEKEQQFDRGHGIYHIVGEERTSLDLANKISMIVKGRPLNQDELEFIDFHSTRPGHDFRYALDGSKVVKFGFSFKMTIDQWFEKMVKWMIDEEHKKWLNL